MSKMRYRKPKPAAGKRWSLRETERELNVSVSTLHYVISQGQILRDAAGVDALSAVHWYENDYNPDRDNARRRRSLRGQTIPEMMAANGGSSGQVTGPELRTMPQIMGRDIANSVQGRRESYLATGTPIAAQKAMRGQYKKGGDQAPVLNTREWVEWFYKLKAGKRSGGKINPKTKSNWDLTFFVRGRFVDTFRVLPIEREVIREYLLAMKNERTHKKVSDGTRYNHFKNISGLYIALKRENSEFRKWLPDLDDLGIPSPKTGGPKFRVEEIRSLLSECRGHDETTIIMTLAQTAARVGELCSIDPNFVPEEWAKIGVTTCPRDEEPATECRCCGKGRGRGAAMLNPHMGGAWVHVFGKVTRANKIGKRELYIPPAAYQALVRHLGAYGRMTLQGRPVTVRRVQDMLRFLMRSAGLEKRNGLLTHGFRRAYQWEFGENARAGKETAGINDIVDEIMGHRSSKMHRLYNVAEILGLLEMAIKYAPRGFLQKELATAALPGMGA